MMEPIQLMKIENIVADAAAAARDERPMECPHKYVAGKDLWLNAYDVAKQKNYFK